VRAREREELIPKSQIERFFQQLDSQCSNAGFCE